MISNTDISWKTDRITNWFHNSSVLSSRNIRRLGS